ncbi:hypothetical protein DY000_02013966 [Brassica cretica]|uniref:CCHC-type domain-containing protein n=1 Tax=Brassica cretica TaxID=69181 RepID=A0ABQ7DAP3_BRACR|nr:hypothetical protein DY000_02013966 [Brassica cretica]
MAGGLSKNSVTPPLDSIKIWAHLTGVPIDLRYDEELSLVAGLVGEPKETDDFTKNMVSLTVSHVKVEVNLNLPLPSVVEFERESGEVVEVQVSYPWVPPTCSHCAKLGHIARNCLKWTPPPQDPASQSSKTSVKRDIPSASHLKSKGGKAKEKIYVEVQQKRPEASLPVPIRVEPLASTLAPVTVALSPKEPLPGHSVLAAPLVPLSLQLPPTPANVVSFLLPFDPSTTPLSIPRRPLKRSRSSPTLSPPLKSDSSTFPQEVSDANSGLPPTSLFLSNKYSLLLNQDLPISSGDPSSSL